MARIQEIKPVPGHDAFARDDLAAGHSQAAFLLVLGGRVQSIDSPDYDGEAVEDVQRLVVPELVSESSWEDSTIAGRTLLAESDARDSYARRTTVPEDVSDLAKKLYEAPTEVSAVRLIVECLYVRDPLVRVAAAAAHSQIFARLARRWMQSEALGGGPQLDSGSRDDGHFARYRRLSRRSVDEMVRGVGEANEIVRDVAATALERLRMDDIGGATDLTLPDAESAARIEDAEDQMERARFERPRNYSIVVHGTTFGRGTGWWKPQRSFHKYLKSHVRANMYSGANPFGWSGLYSDRARRLGAQDLAAWNRNRAAGLDHVFACSHGGSVAMLASRLGVQMKKLVLLSCPVHARYAPNFQRVGKVVSVRTKLDLVILADGELLIEANDNVSGKKKENEFPTGRQDEFRGSKPFGEIHKALFDLTQRLRARLAAGNPGLRTSGGTPEALERRESGEESGT